MDEGKRRELDDRVKELLETKQRSSEIFVPALRRRPFQCAVGASTRTSRSLFWFLLFKVQKTPKEGRKGENGGSEEGGRERRKGNLHQEHRIGCQSQFQENLRGLRTANH